jgi:hypothetical protein
MSAMQLLEIGEFSPRVERAGTMAAVPSKRRSKPSKKRARGRSKPARRPSAGLKHPKKNVGKAAATTKATTGRAVAKNARTVATKRPAAAKPAPKKTAPKKSGARAVRKAVSPPTVKETSAGRAPVQRHGVGMEASYAKDLRERNEAREAGGAAFIEDSHTSDDLAEELGGEAVETMTSGEDEGEDVADQDVPEERG